MPQDEDLRSRDLLIAFSFLDFLTPARTRRLREQFDPIARIEAAHPASVAALLSITEEQARCVTKPLHVPDIRRKVEQLRHEVITTDDAAYPRLLREIPDPPTALFFRGDPGLLDTLAIAVVGSRRASPYGISAAHKLARELSAAGLTIVSGLARGIDAAAHEATLRAGGKTIGVLGTGIDIVYPRFHRRLFDDIASHGLLITEFPPGTPPRPIHFPIRNRIISGLCLGTVVVEASARSGSLITARMASEQGREVFAVPGSILSPGCEGVHRLIQTGAKLLHDVNDLFEELRFTTAPEKAPDTECTDPLLRIMSSDEPMHIDEVLERTGQSVSALAEKLLQLELEGLIRALPGSRYLRVCDG